MYRIPRKRLALAVSAAALPLLVFTPHAEAAASIPQSRWMLVHSSARTAPAAHTVWTGSASFRATKRSPVVRLQVRQLVNGHVVSHKTTSIRSKRSGWKSVKVSIKPVSRPSTLQVLVRRGTMKHSAAKLRGLKVTVSSPVTVAAAPSAPQPASTTPVTWGAPDWRDEFDGTAIDPKKWNVRTKSNLGLTMDGAIPDAGQVSVTGGLLHLKAEWLPTVQARTESATGVKVLTHKTGYIDQRGLKSGDVSRGQQFGRWEIRCKTPTGTNTLGALAAFWLRNNNKGEIDMMEAWGYGKDFPAAGKVMKDNTKTTFFSDTSTTNSLITQVRHHEVGGSAVPWDGFHTYAFELLPNRAAIIEDGKTIWTTTPAKSPAIWGPSFQSPLHMRLNLHVGPSATYWGLPDPNNRSLTKPLDFEVDYVRTWAAPTS